MVKSNNIEEKTTEIILDAISNVREDWKVFRGEVREDDKQQKNTISLIEERIATAWKDIKESRERLRVIETNLDKIEEWEKQYSDLQDSVLAIKKDLYDNGKPGIFTEFKELKEIVEKHSRWIDNKKSNWKLTTVYGTILVTVITICVAIIGVLL